MTPVDTFVICFPVVTAVDAHTATINFYNDTGAGANPTGFFVTVY